MRFQGNINNPITDYVQPTTFSPTITANNQGDLVVSYAEQYGWHAKFGPFAYVSVRLKFTPTFTTAANIVRIQGLSVDPLVNPDNSAVEWPIATGRLQGLDSAAAILGISAFVTDTGDVMLWQSRDNNPIIPVEIDDFTSGAEATLEFAGFYLVGNA